MKKKENWLIIILLVFYIVGFFGIKYNSTREFFVLLTPYNLLLTLAVYTWANGDYRFHFFLTATIIFICGWTIEWAGVHTGILFGQYKYGESLGYKILQVPLIIGVNWFILSFASRSFVIYFLKKEWLVTFFSALSMTFLDVLIEPVAIKLDFWSWRGNAIPFQNYAMWFITSFMMQMILQKSDVKNSFKAGAIVFLIQFLFFAFLNFFICKFK